MRTRLITFLFMTALFISMAGQGSLRPRGDVNCDWEVTIADMNTLLDSVMGGTKYHSFYTYALDINNDEEISIADINALIDGLLGNELPPMPTFSKTLPVLYINTEGYRDIVSKEEYLHADWWLDNMGIDEYESIGSAEAPQGTQIKGRGNSTWLNNGKRPLRLKLDEKQEMLGMPSSRHWILLANIGDWQGKVSDALPFEIGRRMGMSWNPRQEPVEVVLNGQYMGMYFLTEKIRVAQNRVNITEQEENETDPINVTGGWLLEIDNYYDEPNKITIMDGHQQPIWFTPHSPENPNNAQRDYITQFLNAANTAIFAPNKDDCTWEQYIDVDSLAVFYIIQEIVDNIEAFSGSCYMHKERGENTKLVFGPLWDFGCFYYRGKDEYEFDEFIYENVPSFSTVKWIDEIVKFPHFQERVKFHWNHFYHDVYPLMDDYLDAFVARINQAGFSDFDRWHDWGSDYIALRLNRYGKPHFHKKVSWLNSQWGSEATMNDATNYDN